MNMQINDNEKQLNNFQIGVDLLVTETVFM